MNLNHTSFTVIQYASFFVIYHTYRLCRCILCIHVVPSLLPEVGVNIPTSCSLYGLPFSPPGNDGLGVVRAPVGVDGGLVFRLSPGIGACDRSKWTYGAPINDFHGYLGLFHP